MLLKTLAGGPFGVNCYLMVDEKTREAAVVDERLIILPGHGPASTIGEAKKNYPSSRKP